MALSKNQKVQHQKKDWIDQLIKIKVEHINIHFESFSTKEVRLLAIQKIKNTIKDYDIVVCMTNKESQKITRPIIHYLDEK